MAKELYFVHPFVRYAKRTEDIVFALAGLVILMIVAPFIIWKINKESPGSPFYKQLRVGRLLRDRSEIFWMHKFRTMYNGPVKTDKSACDVNVEVRTVENDPRIIPCGHFLRKTRLDELPQMINVLKGDMSIVGPRPDLPSALTEMQEHIAFYEDRTHSLRPGITGLAQVSSGYTLSVKDIKVRADYDAAYAILMAHPLRWLWCELKIIVRTFGVIFVGAGH